MQKAISTNVHFYSFVRAYKRRDRVYFVNTLTGSWAALPIGCIQSLWSADSEEKLYDEVYEALAKALIIRDSRYVFKKISSEIKPLLVKLQITGECNFNCIYCFNDLSIRTHKMDSVTMQRAVDYSFENPYAVRGIYFSIYGGEPLMDKRLLYDTVTYICHKSRHRDDVAVNIITNGSLLTEEDIIFLTHNDVQISISFDGLPGYQDTNRRTVMGGAGSEPILNNILRLKEYQKLNLLITVTREMSSELLNIALFMEKHGIPSIEFLPLRMLGEAADKENISVDIKAYTASLIAIVDAIEDGTIRDLKIRTVIRMLLPLKTGQTIHGDVGYHRCGSGRNVISINYDGSITGCDMIPARFSPVIGNIWDGISQLDQLDDLLLPYGKVSGSCARCPWSLFCRSGCTGASGSDHSTCNTNHLLTCAVNRSLYPYLLEKLVTDGGVLQGYFERHTRTLSS